MDSTRTMIQRQVESRKDSKFSTLGLPPKLLEQSRDRVKLVAGLTAICSFLIMMGDVPALGTKAIAINNFDGLTEWLFVLLSFAMWLMARTRRLSCEFILNAAVAYQISLCALISLIMPWTHFLEARALGVTDHLTDLLPYTTWTAVIIVMFPMIIPSRPARTLGVAIASALTVPAALLLHHLVGNFSVEPRAFVRTLMSPSIATVVAFFGSRVVYNIGLDVSRALQMGSYRLETLLGAGGMGEVWKARHSMLARPAAIKLIKPEVLGAADAQNQRVALSRFEREAQTTAALRSPHTVELYDFGVSDNGSFYYVMELLDGFDLETLVQKFGTVPPGRAIHFLGQACDSLAEAHESGLIHRDIKPANIYACRYGRVVDFVKVLDFGLVKQNTEKDVKLTAQNIAGGTPAFMAPEQILGTSPVDARTDIYALGCVAYWLLTGRLVFEGETPMQVMMHHAQTAPVPVSQRSEEDIPATLESIVMKCLEKDPAARPQTADELASYLAAIEVTGWTPDKARNWWISHPPAPHADAQTVQAAETLV